MLNIKFATNPEIKSYSTIKTAERVFKNDRYWREAEDDERRLILEEYTKDLQMKEEVSDATCTAVAIADQP